MRTRHSPLHWVQEQLPQPTWTSSSSTVTLEREDVPCEAEHASYGEEHPASGEAVTVCCEEKQPDQD